MLPRKTGKPIAIKCTEQFRQHTEEIADSLGKSLSDYCRIAIDAYNQLIGLPQDSTRENNTASKLDKFNKQQDKTKKDNVEKMVQSFMKGNKK